MKAYRIISNEEIYRDIFVLRLEGAIEAMPSTLSMIEVSENIDPFLLRPFSISDKTDNDFTFLYQVKGKGTKILSKKKEGEKIKAINNLGHGFEIPISGKIALVAGGLGLAPMPYLTKMINRKEDITLIAGFPKKSYYIDQITPFVDKVLIATEDGTEGIKGLVTDLLNPKDYDHIMTCGPIPMMRAVYEKAKDFSKVQVSLEERMGCGVGACLGCSVKTLQGMKRVCKDGPVFPAEVIFC